MWPRPAAAGDGGSLRATKGVHNTDTLFVATSNTDSVLFVVTKTRCNEKDALSITDPHGRPQRGDIVGSTYNVLRTAWLATKIPSL
jgi:hypothetical protein